MDSKYLLLPSVQKDRRCEGHRHVLDKHAVCHACGWTREMIEDAKEEFIWDYTIGE